MAYKFKADKSQQPRRGFYEEPEFTPLVDTLRAESKDFTPLTDEYVGFYRNVTDMISPDAMVIGLKYDREKNALIVAYSDGTVEEIKIEDNYLFGASYIYDPLTKSHVALFTLNNGQVIKLDLNAFREKLLEEFKELFYTKDETYTKEEVDGKIKDINSLQWIPLE